MGSTRTVQRPFQPTAARTTEAAPARHRITPAPATPSMPPRPHGDLSRASAQQIVELVNAIWPTRQPRAWLRQAGLTWLLGHLVEGPGDSWQERWDLSVFADGAHRIRELRAGKTRVDGELGHSLMLLCCLRLIHPSLTAFRANRFVRYHQYFEAAQDDADLRRFLDRVEAQDTSPHYKRCARLDVAAALTTQGIVFADLTPEGFLHYATQTRAGGWGAGYEHYVGHLAWKVMHETGHFPPDVPATLRGALRAPAATPAELVDSYQLRNQPVRDLLVDYLTRRSHDLDHSTLRGLARDLCSAFWKQIEQINPDQADLALSEDTYRQWRQALATRRDRQPRLSAEAIATNVRALYLDLQGWAAAEPERWGRWVAPSPIPQQTRARATANRRTGAPRNEWTPASAPCNPSSPRSSPRSATVATTTSSSCRPPRPQSPDSNRGSGRRATSGSTPPATHAQPGSTDMRTSGSSTSPPASPSTSHSPKTPRSGSGPRWRPSPTPDCAARNSSNSHNSASANTSGPTAR